MNKENKSEDISKEGIIGYLNANNKNCNIYIYDTVTSTNLLAKEFIKEGKESDKTIIIAKEQTQGRGRHGKKFFSPLNKGIYMSMILSFQDTINKIPYITSYVAIAVCRSIEKITTLKPKIKWVNDVFISDKKLSGILTETAYTLDSNNYEIVLGIGINISTTNDDFPDELKNIATSLQYEKISKNELIANIINEVIYFQNNNIDILDTYKKYSMMIGKKIRFVKDKEYFTGTVIDINEKINLVVLTNSGEEMILSSGETTLLK